MNHLKPQCEIARFLSVQTDHMRNIRNSLPTSNEQYSFHHEDETLNWYQFWDHISSCRPSGAKLKTNSFEVRYSDSLLMWELSWHSECPIVSRDSDIIIANLNEYEAYAKLLRQWERRKASLRLPGVKQ